MPVEFDPPASINSERLLNSLRDLGRIGELESGGVARLALSDQDAAGRAWVIEVMRDIGLDVRVDQIGNVVGYFEGSSPDLAPVMVGSHIDTVYGGGDYDGNLGVLAGIELLRTIIESKHRPTRGIEVAFFANEEGSRFSPDMMGSLVYIGDLSLEEALKQRDARGITVEEELIRGGLSGSARVPGRPPFAFVELHVEQGPVLDRRGIDVGIVTAVQGINWRRLHIRGTANHAGTAPMAMRTDACLGAAQVIVKARKIGVESDGAVVATVGHLSLKPNLVNVVPSLVEMTIDMRSPDDNALMAAVVEMENFIEESLSSEGCEYTLEEEVALEAHQFSDSVVEVIEESAEELGLGSIRMVSGAGHDAQIIGRVSQAGMIFVPSVGGISHNPSEHTEPSDLVNGGNLLLVSVLKLCEL